MEFSNILLQILLGVVFLILALLCFTCPFLAFLKKYIADLDDLEQFTIYSVFGLVIFTLSAYSLTLIHLRFLMWIFPVLGIYSLIKFKSAIFSFRPKISHKIIFSLVFAIGIIGMVAVNAPSGWKYSDGIYFYSSHGHDGVWHLALMEQMKKGDSFQNPELAGANLQNYHFFVDLLMSEFSRLFSFSSLDIYFRFMPVVFAVLLGLAGFAFVRSWTKSELAGIWAMIFIFFAGSFGYVVTLINTGNIAGEAAFWVSQTQSVLGNPPHAVAFIITTVFLFCFWKYLNTRKLIYFFLCVILGGSVIEFKVYAGVLILGGLLIVAGWEVLRCRMYGTLFLFLVTLAISITVYLPNSQNSQDFLIWQPWWYIRTMVVAPDRLNFLDLELRRQTYIAEHNLKRVIQVETTAFLIFLFGNLGMRFLGFWTIFKLIKQNIFRNSFNLFLLSITAISFLIPVFFLQKGVAWNSIQFNQYFLLFFGFLAAATMPDLLKIFKQSYLELIVSILIILLAIPTQLGLLKQFYSNKPLSKVSLEELEALKILENQKDGIVLVAPFNKYERDKYMDPPIPIYAWYDTGYVSAFSKKKTLISDEEQVTIMGYDTKKALDERKIAFETKNPSLINDFLKKYKINYVYLAWDQKFATESATINMGLIFENKDARVFKVKNEAK